MDQRRPLLCLFLYRIKILRIRAWNVGMEVEHSTTDPIVFSQKHQMIKTIDCRGFWQISLSMVDSNDK